MPSGIPTSELLPSEKHLPKKVAVFLNVKLAVNVNSIALFHSKNGSAMQNLGSDMKIWLGWGNVWQLYLVDGYLV